MTRLIVRGKPTSLAAQVFKDAQYKSSMIVEVGKNIKKEVKLLCSNKTSSCLRNTKKQDLIEFSWEKLFTEAQYLTPCLLQMLKSCLDIKSNKNSSSIIGMFISVLCYFRRSSMNILQRIVAVILYSGHCSKQVHTYTLYTLHINCHRFTSVCINCTCVFYTRHSLGC